MKNKYAAYTPVEMEELFSNYLIDSWSYSKVSTFSRNEKEFEKTYIYREPSRRSASSVAGNAYHAAIELFFMEWGKGHETGIVEMETVAFAYIEDIPACDWKLQKTTPTVESCKIKATKSAAALIRNFYTERELYTGEIAEVFDVETRVAEWLVVNGVDIPLPCHAVIDLVIHTRDGKNVIIDHKSKTKYTDEEETALIRGKQAITYALAYEAGSGIRIDEVWFVENKETQNSDGSPQMRLSVLILDADNRKLYEALLYEPLKRMIEAVSDPDYVYTVNDADNFCDRAELYRFWAKTLIAEVDDFDLPEEKKELIARRQKKIRDASRAMITPKVITRFRDNAAAFIRYDLSLSDMTNPEKISHVLRSFGIIANVAHEITGYSSTSYLLEVTAGTKIAGIAKYRLDIANALNVPSVRIGDNLMVYQGRSYLVIESPQKGHETLYWDKKYLEEEKIPLGKDNFGNLVVWDLNNHSTPHMLICGATGSGKSVSIISTINYAVEAGIDHIVIFDPKYEFIRYRREGIEVYNDIQEIESEMKRLVDDMQQRAKSGNTGKKTLVIFDEFADAVSSARSGTELDIKEMVQVGTRKVPFGFPEPKMELRTVGREKSLEENLKMLLQKGRSLGFRIIAATQRASVNVITGDAKVNFPVIICFRVPKEVDSKVVIEEAGAETLNGMGDGLIKSPEYFGVVRFQGFYKK